MTSLWISGYAYVYVPRILKQIHLVHDGIKNKTKRYTNHPHITPTKEPRELLLVNWATIENNCDLNDWAYAEWLSERAFEISFTW